MHIYTQWINLSIIYKTIRITLPLLARVYVSGIETFGIETFHTIDLSGVGRKLKGRGGLDLILNLDKQKKGGMSIVMWLSNFAQKKGGRAQYGLPSFKEYVTHVCLSACTYKLQLIDKNFELWRKILNWKIQLSKELIIYS